MMKTRRTQFTWCKRLASTRGETIVETLIAVLISSLALLMMATAIGTAVNMIKTSRVTMEATYSDESGMIASKDVSPQPSTTTSGSIDYSVPLELEEDGTPKDIDVIAYSEEEGESAFYEREVSE